MSGVWHANTAGVKPQRLKARDMDQKRFVRMDITDKNAVYIDGTRVTGRETKWGIHKVIWSQDVISDEVSFILNKLGLSHIRLDPVYAKELNVL